MHYEHLKFSDDSVSSLFFFNPVAAMPNREFMFYADIEGHPDERPVKLAIEELAFFTSEVRVLGTYKASPFRAELKAG